MCLGNYCKIKYLRYLMVILDQRQFEELLSRPLAYFDER